jgi:hypothetical protein
MDQDYEYSLYIYSKGELENGRDEIEDGIEELLGDIVEVSGGGSGAFGWNVDVELLEPTKLEFALAQIRSFLAEMKVSSDTHIDVIRRHKVRIYDE